jgi:hypothetical protein
VSWRSLGIAIFLSLMAVTIFDQESTGANEPAAIYTRYFADGATGSFFLPAVVTIQYLPPATLR